MIETTATAMREKDCMLESLEKKKADYLLIKQQKASRLEDSIREKKDLGMENDELKGNVT